MGPAHGPWSDATSACTNTQMASHTQYTLASPFLSVIWVKNLFGVRTLPNSFNYDKIYTSQFREEQVSSYAQPVVSNQLVLILTSKEFSGGIEPWPQPRAQNNQIGLKKFNHLKLIHVTNIFQNSMVKKEL